VQAQNDPTENEIHEMAASDWMGTLAKLWTAAGKPIDADRLDVYREALGFIPTGLLEQAVMRVVREHIYANVPQPAVVIDALKAELGHPSNLDNAIENWIEQEWSRGIVQFA
jgi:hypothetical protein